MHGTHQYIYICICICKCKCICMCICINTYVYMYIYIYKYVYAYMYVYMYIYIPAAFYGMYSHMHLYLHFLLYIQINQRCQMLLLPLGEPRRHEKPYSLWLLWSRGATKSLSTTSFCYNVVGRYCCIRFLWPSIWDMLRHVILKDLAEN